MFLVVHHRMGMPRVAADSFQRKLLVDASIAPQCCLLGGHRKALDCRALFGYSSEINDLRRTVVHFLQQSMISKLYRHVFCGNMYENGYTVMFLFNLLSEISDVRCTVVQVQHKSMDCVVQLKFPFEN